MPDADEASVLTLAERALVSALQSGLNLSRFGVDLRIAINVPVKCLTKLPSARSCASTVHRWTTGPG